MLVIEARDSGALESACEDYFLRWGRPRHSGTWGYSGNQFNLDTLTLEKSLNIQEDE